MMFNDPLSGLGIGISVPAAFWLAAISFTLFSVGYVEMARRVTTAGGFYSYTSYGFGRIIGLGTAIGIVVAYALFAVGVNGVTTYFANTSLNDLFGISMDWRIYAFLFIALLFMVTYFHVEIVARILGICLLGELVILFVFSFTVLFKGGGPDGIVWSCTESGRHLRRRRRRQAAPPRCSAPRPPASGSSGPTGPGSASRWRRTTPRRPATRRR